MEVLLAKSNNEKGEQRESQAQPTHVAAAQHTTLFYHLPLSFYLSISSAERMDSLDHPTHNIRDPVNTRLYYS